MFDKCHFAIGSVLRFILTVIILSSESISCTIHVQKYLSYPAYKHVQKRFLINLPNTFYVNVTISSSFDTLALFRQNANL